MRADSVNDSSIHASVAVVALPQGQVIVVHFRILGSFEAIEHDQPVALGGPKQRAVIVLLLLGRI